MKPALLFVAFWISAVGSVSGRSWTNVQGRVIDADLVAADDTNVSLKLKDGNVVSIPIVSLSAADQAFVRSQTNTDVIDRRRTPVEKRVWPDLVQVSTAELEKVTLVPTDKPGFIYRSASFEFSSEVKLLPSLIKEVARTFEATKRLVEALPWGIECQPPEGRERYLAALYQTRASYLAAGGPENSSGVYMSGDMTFRIPFESLGIKRLGESYTRDASFSNETLVHEITHQMMHDYLPFLPKWAVEGTAEFTEMIPYKAGTFRVGNHEKGLVEYLGGNPKSIAAKLPRFQELFRMTRTEWNKQSEPGSSGHDAVSRQQELYQQSALLVYYFNFLDGDARKQGYRWMRFLEAVHAEVSKRQGYYRSVTEFFKKQDEFLKLPGVETLPGGRIKYPSKLTPPLPPPLLKEGGPAYDDQTPLKHLDLLLDGRTEAAVEQEMLSKFTAIGLAIHF